MGLLFDTIANASRIAPVLTDVLPTLDRGLTGDPITKKDADWLFYTLQAAEHVVPAITPLIPVIRKKFDGVEISPDDHQAATTAADAIMRQVESKGGSASPKRYPQPSIGGSVLVTKPSPRPPEGFSPGSPKS